MQTNKFVADQVIGIDLGTTNTCVACYENGQVNILENEEGGRTTPSFLFVTEKDKVIVGHFAKRMAEAKPEYAISDIKRLIGRKFDDPYVQNNVQYFPFSVVNSNNEPVVSIRRSNNEFKRTTIELCAAILKKVKDSAEAKLNAPVEKAVITVPAYFNVNQREATLAAAKEAGLTVLKLLNEPTAAALRFYLQHKDDDSSTSLVYDLGGGTFDVAILRKDGDNIDIIGVDGDTHLGGHDFDNLIVDYVCNYLQEHYKYDPRPDRRAMRRIYKECEDAKKDLSIVEEVSIALNGFVKNHDTIEITLTREQFELMCSELFQKTINIVKNCLKTCKIEKTGIKEVILSGGSTRIPKIQNMISTYFNGKKLNKVINLDECIAEGAAIQAALLSESKKQTIRAFKITDVTPLSLGIANFVDLMTVCIKRNTPIPVSKTVSRVTVENQQKSMRFEIFEGERLNVKKNRHLGTVVINNITPAPPGLCEALVTISIDANGILKVTAKEKHRNNVKDLTIVYTRGLQSDKEVQNALNDAESHKREDERFVKFAHLKEYVLDYCERVRYNLEKKKLSVTYKGIYDLCAKTREEAEIMNLEDDRKLEALRSKIKSSCSSIVSKYNFELMPVLRR